MLKNDSEAWTNEEKSAACVTLVYDTEEKTPVPGAVIQCISSKHAHCWTATQNGRMLSVRLKITGNSVNSRHNQKFATCLHFKAGSYTASSSCFYITSNRTSYSRQHAPIVTHCKTSSPSHVDGSQACTHVPIEVAMDMQTRISNLEMRRMIRRSEISVDHFVLAMQRLMDKVEKCQTASQAKQLKTLLTHLKRHLKPALRSSKRFHLR